MFERDIHLRETGTDHEWHPKYIDVVACLYIGALVITWVTGSKLFSLGPFILNGGIFAFPLTCIFGDVLTEIYGFNRTRRLIWMGFICGLMFLGIVQLVVWLPPAPAYKQQDAFAAINGTIPRIIVASYVAYVVCEFTNSIIMSKMKNWSQARNFPLRAVVSTCAAQLVDSMVFFTLAFAGTLSFDTLLWTILSGWIFKCLYEIIAVPFTTIFVNKLKKLEGVEHFDRHKLEVFKF